MTYFLYLFRSKRCIMIRKQKKQFLAALYERVSGVPQRIKKEKTRLKLRRRGSFVDSSWMSLVLRPVLEWHKTKALVGAPLVAAMVSVSALSPLADPGGELFRTKSPEVLAVSI